MDCSVFKVVPLAAEYIEDVTLLWRESMSEALGINPVHSFESQAYFLEHILPNNYQIMVVISVEQSKPVAFMAYSEMEVNQLYISLEFQRKGIGTYLLNLAKQKSSGALSLRTFEVNKRAQLFYKAHGFKLSAGNCDNEEGLSDLECVWQREH